MKAPQVFTAALVAALHWHFHSSAAAQSCKGTITRADVAPCALRASLALQQAHSQLQVLEGQRLAASPLLPRNPELTLSAAHRSSTNQQGANWYATLSQELEIGGQRSARRDQVDAARFAQNSALAATERDVAALAWRVYFEALAARDLLTATAHLEQVFAQSSAATQAGAAQGLVSGVDAEVSELHALRLTRERIEAERRAQTTLAALSLLLGREPAAAQTKLPGELSPLTQAAALPLEQLDARVEQRAEVVRAKQLQALQEAARATLERSRVPNITLSLSAQRDGFGEQVFGGGIALPLPLPYPVGRTLHGELMENAALKQTADLELAQTRRALKLELLEAFYAQSAASAQAELYTSERVERAQRSLESLAQALQAGRVPISEAIVAQQTLVEFTRESISAKLELCLASIEVARSAGLALWGAGL